MQIRERGDRDQRRAEYLKAKCKRLHGLESDGFKVPDAAEKREAAYAARKARYKAMKDQKASRFPGQAGRPAGRRIKEAQIANELPTRPDGSPLYGRMFWEKYWKLYPETTPSKGENADECFENFKAFVRELYIVPPNHRLHTPACQRKIES